jgi:hypothetical protein
MGATVVTTFSFFSALTGGGFSSCRPQAVKKSANAKMNNHVLMIFVSFICEKRGLFFSGSDGSDKTSSPQHTMLLVEIRLPFPMRA